MATLLVPEHQRTPKEALLLGDLTVTAYDCDGTPVEVHGLLANDLLVRNGNGTTTPLLNYILAGGVGGDLGDSVVARTDGSTITLREIADNIVPLNAISAAEAQADLDSIPDL